MSVWRVGGLLEWVMAVAFCTVGGSSCRADHDPVIGPRTALVGSAGTRERRHAALIARTTGRPRRASSGGLWSPTRSACRQRRLSPARPTRPPSLDSARRSLAYPTAAKPAPQLHRLPAVTRRPGLVVADLISTLFSGRIGTTGMRRRSPGKTRSRSTSRPDISGTATRRSPTWPPTPPTSSTQPTPGARRRPRKARFHPSMTATPPGRRC